MHFISIEQDRYGGAYSGATWTAWVGNAPEDTSDGDGTCEAFWNGESGEIPVHGRGETRLEAMHDLLTKTDRCAGSFDVIDIGDPRLPGFGRYLIRASDQFVAWFGSDGY